MASAPGNKTVNTSSELAAIDAPIGTEIWVVDDQQNWQAVPREPESGGIAGPSTSLRMWWAPADVASGRFGPFSSIAEFRAATPPSVLTSYVIEGEGDYVYKPDWGANTVDDGMYVLKSDSVDAASNGRGVRLATNNNRSPNIYGNRNVCRRLLDSLTPATKVTLVRVGDSRSVETPTTFNMLTYCYGIPWGGQRLSITSYDAGASAPWSAVAYSQPSGDGTVATPINEWLGRWSIGNGYAVVMEDGTAPSGGVLNRCIICSESYNTSTLLALKPQFVGRQISAHVFFNVGPEGVTTDSLQVRIHGTTYGTPSAAFGTYAASRSTVRYSATIPTTWNWTTEPSVTGSVIVVAGAATRLGEYVYAAYGVLESDIGVTYVNTSVGGRTIDGFLTDDTFAPTLWSQDVASLSGEKVLWLSLGTNGLAHNGRDAWLVKAQQLIARFRTAQPNGYVLMDTAYDGSPNVGSILELQRAARKLCELDGRVCVIDTAAELGGYPYMLAAGLFGGSPDGVHFVDAGKNELAKQIGKMVAAAASAD